MRCRTRGGTLRRKQSSLDRENPSVSDFRQLSPDMLASPQIGFDDLMTAKELGVALVINNRPDGEAPDEPQGAEIEAAARSLGMDYLAIPIGHSGFSEPQVSGTADRRSLPVTNGEPAVDRYGGIHGKVLGYCRSGTRSTLLWSLAQARAGHDPDEIAAAARNAGYDVSPVRPAMDMLAAKINE